MKMKLIRVNELGIDEDGKEYIFSKNFFPLKEFKELKFTKSENYLNIQIGERILHGYTEDFDWSEFESFLLDNQKKIFDITII